MLIWYGVKTIDELREKLRRLKTAYAQKEVQGPLLHHNLGIEIVDIGEDYLKMSMPVDERTRQPFGILHGGASCALADTVAGFAGSMCINFETHSVVALDLHTTHIRSVIAGVVTATARPVYFGKSIQVWEVNTRDDKDKPIAVTRITLFVKVRANQET